MLIIFTDLDGTLLDKRYSWKKASKALAMIRKKKIPLVFCTSKTKAESEFWQKKLRNKDPFIVENGGCIVIPKNYFNNKNQKIVRFGTDTKKLKKVLNKIEKLSKSKIWGFSEMPIKEVKNYTGLPLNQAKLAKKREYTEPFRLIKGDSGKIKKLIKENKLSYTKTARFHYIMGDSDKGKAVKILIKFYKKKYGKIETIGFGNDLNDKLMLNAVDKPYLLKKGPAEWNKIVLKLLK